METSQVLTGEVQGESMANPGEGEHHPAWGLVTVMAPFFRHQTMDGGFHKCMFRPGRYQRGQQKLEECL